MSPGPISPHDRWTRMRERTTLREHAALIRNGDRWSRELRQINFCRTEQRAVSPSTTQSRPSWQARSREWIRVRAKRSSKNLTDAIMSSTQTTRSHSCTGILWYVTDKQRCRCDMTWVGTAIRYWRLQHRWRQFSTKVSSESSKFVGSQGLTTFLNINTWLSHHRSLVPISVKDPLWGLVSLG